MQQPLGLTTVTLSIHLYPVLSPEPPSHRVTHKAAVCITGGLAVDTGTVPDLPATLGGAGSLPARHRVPRLPRRLLFKGVARAPDGFHWRAVHF